ncbi:MAG: NUDIX domain-containing protein [Kiritimatiellia bacterium]
MMDKNRYIEVIARGVCIRNKRILLCFGRKSGIAYLPGGHVDFGENGKQALEREIEEEMGLKSVAGQFLGCCEHWFIQNGRRHAEVNLVYQLDVSGLDADRQPESVEDWIGFIWQPFDQLDEIRFEPAELGAELAVWVASPGQYLSSGY